MLLESSNTCTSIICRLDPRMCCLTTRLLARDKFFLNLRKLVSIPHFYIISYITLGDSRLCIQFLPSKLRFFNSIISRQLAEHEPRFQRFQFIILNNTEVVRLVFPSLRNSGCCQTCRMTLAQHSDIGGVTGVFR